MNVCSKNHSKCLQRNKSCDSLFLLHCWCFLKHLDADQHSVLWGLFGLVSCCVAADTMSVLLCCCRRALQRWTVCAKGACKHPCPCLLVLWYVCTPSGSALESWWQYVWVTREVASACETSIFTYFIFCFKNKPIKKKQQQSRQPTSDHFKNLLYPLQCLSCCFGTLWL